jgi:hypothetical protein
VGVDGTAVGVPSDPQATTTAAHRMLLSTTGVRVNSEELGSFIGILSCDLQLRIKIPNS